MSLAILVCTLGFVATVLAQTDTVPGGEVVIRQGQEELLAEMLGRGVTFPGECLWAGGEIDRAVIRSRYTCSLGEVAFELRHPSQAPATATQTLRFAIVLLSGSAPPNFAAALESRIRAAEPAFQWTWLPPPATPAAPPAPTRRSSLTPVVLVFTILAVAVLVRAVQRRQQWRQTARRHTREAIDQLKLFLRSERLLVLLIFLISVAARGWLSIVNPQANDDHLSVVSRILEQDWSPPPREACVECYQPKLYHYACAALFAFATHGSRAAANLLNCVAGTVLLVLLYRFTRNGRWSPPVRLLGTAFMAFNAALVGITSQATNDAFCILFCSLGIYYLGRFFATARLREVIAATVFMIVAALSKASGWLMFATGAGSLCWRLLCATAHRKQYLVATAVFVLGFLSVVPFVDPYAGYIKRFHTPLVGAAPQFMAAGEVQRPRLTWLFQDLLTFRIVDLIRVPYVDFNPGPLHRTSLWSQLYARMFFLRFDHGIWENDSARTLPIGRVCLVLGLLPLAALLLGTWHAVRVTSRALWERRWTWFAESADWTYLGYVAVVLVMMVTFVVQYRHWQFEFTWMKAIYLFPALLAFYKLFLDGLEVLWARRPHLVTGWMAALLAASFADLCWLIHDLSGTAGL